MRGMSVSYDHGRRRWVVRWNEAGKRRVRRFVDEADARAFATTVVPGRGQDIASDIKRGDGVYVYETKDGPRYRFSFRQSDGTLSTRRASRAVARRSRRAGVSSSRSSAARSRLRGRPSASSGPVTSTTAART